MTEWNSTLAYVMPELGVGTEVCWPHSPNQKGSVENLVGWVKGSLFEQRRLHDQADLEEQLREWIRDTHTKRPNRATGVIPAERLAEEAPRLRPRRCVRRTWLCAVPFRWDRPHVRCVSLRADRGSVRIDHLDTDDNAHTPALRRLSAAH